MFKRTICLLIGLALSLTVAACSNSPALTTPPNTEDIVMNYEKEASDFAELLRSGQFEDCTVRFSDQMKSGLPEGKLKEAWNTVTALSGEYIALEKTESEQKDGFEIVRLYLAHSVQGVIVQVTFDKTSKISGLWFNYYQSELSEKSNKLLPDGLLETSVTVGTGELALSGKLTKAVDKQSEYAVVLVHGSGPQDMDETISGNKPFRDIAWGLAAKGIDMLRYDKRTFAHPEWFAKPENSAITVKEETIDDAVSAAKLLSDMGYDKIYLLGHSLGGMLAPRIYFDSGELFSGIIIMAGSTRTLTDIMIDQNNDVIATLPPEQKKAGEDILNAEIAKLANLDKLTDKQLLTEKVFGMPGLYAKEMNSYDTATLAAKISKPILVLQGAEDFQVFANKDYLLWQDALKNNSLVQFKLYEGLTHLFTKAPDVQTRTIKDYTPSGEVAPQVIEDIAKFIKREQ